MAEPTAAMIFAAGFGTRMRPLTDERPKPLIEIAGQTLLDHAVGLVEGVGARVVVNAHYKGEMVKAHLAGRPDIEVIVEAPEVLDTGGGLKNARQALSSDPVFTLNSDAIWAGPNPLSVLAEAWRPGMEALLLLVPQTQTVGFSRTGDFGLDAKGRLRRDPTGLVFGGAQILRTGRLDGIAEQVFSLNLLWDQCLADGTAFGVKYPGHWADVGTPEGIGLAEAMLRDHDVV